jgi:hypothetical protein
MGREIKRVPVGFDWPLGKVWWGYLLDSVQCKTCNGTGKTSIPVLKGFQLTNGEWHTYESEFCPVCGGEGMAFPVVEVPDGPGYQLWETTSEGSPISPAKGTPEELARWLSDNRASAFAGMTQTFEQWLAFIVGSGHAVSAVFNGSELVSGVEFSVSDKEKED